MDFDVYLPALRNTGFDGFLTIEREVGDDPVADISILLLRCSFLAEENVKTELDV